MRISVFFLAIVLFCSCHSDEADEPELRTNAATSIGLSRAVLQGEVKEVGPLKPIHYGFLWSTESGVTVLSAKSKTMVGEASQGGVEYSVEISELLPNTEYFVRAFATNDAQTSIYYGNEVSFKTTQPSQYVATLATENITSSSVLLKGEVLDLNELENATYGFAWSVNPFTSLLNAQVVIVGETNAALIYETSLNSLQPQTTYYYRAFLSNEAGTLLVYGELLSFSTLN